MHATLSESPAVWFPPTTPSARAEVGMRFCRFCLGTSLTMLHTAIVTVVWPGEGLSTFVPGRNMYRAL
jgi:hypothetical protein